MARKDKKRLVLALDGHDGSGKTTLAKYMAEKLGGTYTRPFSGTAGELMLWSAERGDFDFASRLGRKLIERELEVNDANILIFDRAWMTVFTLIPEVYWAEWEPLSPTMLCWADIDTTLSRLGERNEISQDVSYHLMYMQKYQSLAHRFSCPVLHTDRLSVDACIKSLIEWASCFI